MSNRALGNQFVPARELFEQYRHVDTQTDPWGLHGMSSEEEADAHQTWLAKMNTANSTGLTAHIARYGVQAPIPIDSAGMMMDGHHRLAAALQIDPDMPIPTRWDEDEGIAGGDSPAQVDEQGRRLPRAQTGLDPQGDPEAGPAR